MELVGTIKQIGEIQQFESGFFKQEILLVTDDEKYPQTVPIEFPKEKTNLLSEVAEGMKVKVGINIRGSEWQGRHFVSLTGWRVDALEAPSQPAPAPQPAAAPPPSSEEDNLPF